MIKFLKKELEDYKILLRNIPALVVSLFILSVVAMNLLANKELFTASWVALDCGFSLSWISFLCMDCICKRYGSKASIKISVLAITINLCLTCIFKLISLTPGMWGEFYTTESMIVNQALNTTLGGTWYVVFGSAIAMFISSVVNSLLNVSLGKLCHKDNYKAFAFRSFISTGIAQFVDNLCFAILVSKVFFGWTWLQVFSCSIVAALFELLMEILFSGFGYKMAKLWEKENVGQEYLEHLKRE